MNSDEARDWVVHNDPLLVVRWDDNVVEALGYPVRSDYAEMYWLPVIGPSALWMLRRLSGLHGVEVGVATLARELGLGLGIGRHTPVVRTAARLITFGMADVVPRSDGDYLGVRLAVPPLTRRQLERLPDHLQTRHRLEMVG